MILFDKKYCTLYEGLESDIKGSQDFSDLMKLIDEDLEATVFPKLREWGDFPDAETEEMHDICNYILWAKSNDLKLSINLSDKQFREC